MTRRRISPRERIAIFQRENGCCYLCQQKIGVSDRWDIEHELPLAMGGDETPMSENLRAAHAKCHQVKSATDSWNLAKAKRRQARHLGAVKPRSRLSHPTMKRKLDGTVVPRDGGR